MLSHFSLTEEILQEKAFFFFFIFIFDVMQTLINIKKFSKFYPDLSFYFLRFFFFFLHVLETSFYKAALTLHASAGG